MIAALADAITNHQPLPKFDAVLSLDEAYALQHRLTESLCPDGRGGLKAGVTAAPAQQFFGLGHALLGSLYPQGRLQPGCTLPHLPGRMVELEIAVFLDAEGRPVGIAPALELVYVKFGDDGDFSAANLTACNLGADQFIIGDRRPWSEDVKLTMTLSRDGSEVSVADSSEALGGPTAAAAWMWAEAAKRGFKTGGETVLLTGACGQVVPGEAGSYHADYGQLGSISFSISED